MQPSRQRTMAQGGDGFSWLIATTLCLILIVCLISAASSTSFRARTFDVFRMHQ